jgi:hypothetical protein
VVRLSPCAHLPTTRRTHSSACWCSTARFANIIYYLLHNDTAEYTDDETFWDIVRSVWTYQKPWTWIVPLEIDGLLCESDDEDILTSGGEEVKTIRIQRPLYDLDDNGQTPKGFQNPIFPFETQFDEIRSTSNRGRFPECPTPQQLKKKFEEFLHMFVPLYDPDKYADLESINDQECLRNELEKLLASNTTSGERLATWYLFCALHASKVFAREKLGGSVLADYPTK